MKPLFEALESRDLFSSTPISAQPAPEPTGFAHMVFSTMSAIPKMLGTWVGKLSIPGIHTQPVKIVFTKQTSKGVFKGTLTTSADSSISVAVTGKVKSNGRVTITLTGGHSGGSINGSGAGKLKTGHKKISLAMNFTQGNQTFPGTITLAKA